MPYICYVNKAFRGTSSEIIDQANDIIDEYRRQGFLLTLRQLYYQFVSRDLLPNSLKSYKRLGGIINDGRMAGLIDWNAIEDRTRNVKRNPHWSSPAEILRSCEEQFAYDKWESQPYAPEVWIEKDALVGVIEGVCRGLDVPFFACRGYSSQSEQWRAGVRFEQAIAEGRIPILFHLGDHDPSGIDMTRDNQDRLSLFARKDVEVRRLALNWDQIHKYNPPPNPAKDKDSRFHAYKAQYGKASWELDALDPRVISSLIRDAIMDIRDEAAWAESEEREQEAREDIRMVRVQMEKKYG